MATITIPCIDSIGYLIHQSIKSGNDWIAVSGVADDLVVSMYNETFNVGYQKSNYEVSRSSGASAYPMAFSFQNVDVSVLNTSSVISALLKFKVALTRNTGIRLYTTNEKIVIQAGKNGNTGRDIHYVLESVLNQSNLFKQIDETEANQEFEIDLTNDISTLKSLITGGLKIASFVTNIGAYTAVYGFNCAYSPTIEIEYLSDETPPVVTPASPVSDVVNGDQPITFTWRYSQDVNEPQSHYSIQYQSSGDWTTLIPQTAGTAQTATVAANSLPAGQVAWRVMAWSQNGTIQSNWSEPAYIIVQSQPKAPNITNAGTSPSPTFTWQASQQQGYEIKLGDYYDAIQFGVERTWTYPGTLPDGNVIFQIRIQNAQGIWSPWAGVETYISNVPQGNLSLSANVVNQSVSLTWTGTGFTSSQYNVYRGGELIATVSGTSFTDYYSAGKHTYQVYAMLSGGYYTPSNAITEIVRPKYAMISLVSSISWIPLRIRSGGRPTYSSEKQAQASFVHYQGRVLPVAYTTGFLDKSYSYSFSFLHENDMKSLAKLCGQMVILKTPVGERVIGILTGISDNRQQRINDFSFSITEIDFSEVDLNAANNVEVSSFP